MLLKLGNFIRHPSKNSSMESHDVKGILYGDSLYVSCYIIKKTICKVDFFCKVPMQEFGISGTNVAAQNATYKNSYFA